MSRKTGWTGKIGDKARRSLVASFRTGFLILAVVLLPVVFLSVHYLTSLMSHSDALKLDMERLKVMQELDLELDRLQVDSPMTGNVRVHLVALKRAGTATEELIRLLETAGEQRRHHRQCEGLLGVARMVSPARLPVVCKTDDAMAASIAFLHDMRGEALRQAGTQRTQLAVVADDAVRNLVTLTILTLLMLAYAIFRYPRRLVVPLERLAGYLKQVEGGRTDVVVPSFGVKEVDALVKSLNNALASQREFDAKKRGRIQQDRNKLETLLERLNVPGAILDLGLRLDLCNPQFRTLFSLPTGWHMKPLSDFLEVGAEGLRKEASWVVSSRTRRTVQLVIDKGESRVTLNAEIVPVQIGIGDVTALILLLDETKQPQT